MGDEEPTRGMAWWAKLAEISPAMRWIGLSLLATLILVPGAATLRRELQDGTPNVTPPDEGWRQSTAAADLATVPLTVIHESGFWNYPKATVEDGCMVSSASAGRTTFVLGGDFSGWREQVLELDLSAGAHEVRGDLAREPLLELRASDPSRLTGEVWIQVGQDSVLWRGKALPIPPGREVVVLGQPEDGSVWRLTANPAEVNLVLDVDSAEHVRGRRADAGTAVGCGPAAE